MKAKASMSVTPGSETLWSVQVGHRCCTSRLASSTRSWNRRSSRLGAGSTVVSLLRRDHIEGEDEVAGVVGAAAHVVDLDPQGGGGHGIHRHVDLDDLHSGFPALQRGADLVGDPAGGGGVGGGEDEVVDGAAELRPHRPLAGGGGQDE